MRLLYVRSPEASFRPEVYISNALVAAAKTDGLDVVDLQSKDFDNLSDQSNFYEPNAMSAGLLATTSQLVSLLQADDIVFIS